MTVDRETFDLLVGHGTSAVDFCVIGHPLIGSRESANRCGYFTIPVEGIVERALWCLVDNGLVIVVPREDWPTYVYPDGKPPWVEAWEVGSVQENRPATG